MIAHPPRRALHPLALALVALLLAAAAVLSTPRSAAAHDALLSSDPAAGASVEQLPASLTLSFSAALLPDEGGTVVEVTDAAGTQLAAGAPTVDQNVVTQPLEGDATGTVTVRWRVVSSDGHPVSGEYAFSVAGSAPVTPAPAPPASESVAPSPEASPSETAAVTTTAEDDAASPLPWIIGGVAVLLVLAAVIALLGARARQGKETAQTRTAGRDDLGGR